MDPFLPYQVELVKIADRLAAQGGDGSETGYLKRFRIIYRHLAASVMGMSIESGMSAMAMGVGPACSSRTPRSCSRRPTRS